MAAFRLLVSVLHAEVDQQQSPRSVSIAFTFWGSASFGPLFSLVFMSLMFVTLLWSLLHAVQAIQKWIDVVVQP